MKVEVEELPKSRVRFRIELESSEVQPHLSHAVQRISEKKPFPGFRPGKAPFDLVAKSLGEATIWEEAIEDIVRTSYVKVIREHKTKVIGQPEVQVEKIAPGNPVVYTATVAVLPVVNLAPYERLRVERKTTHVSDEDVERAIEDMRGLLASRKPIERPAKFGDHVELDVDVFIDKVPVEGGRSRRHPLILGEGAFIPGFEDRVVGMRKGETKEFVLAFPKDYRAQNLAGKIAGFRVTAQEVAELEKPDLNDAFAQRVAQVESVEKLRKRAHADLEKEQTERDDDAYEVALLNELVKRSTFGELPDVLIQSEVDRMVHELKHDVEKRGMKFPDYLATMKKDETALRNDLLPRARERVKTALVIRTVAVLEKVEVTEGEVAAEIERARQSAPQEQRNSPHFASEDFRDYVRTVLTNRKAVAAVKAKQSAPV